MYYVRNELNVEVLLYKKLNYYLINPDFEEHVFKCT